MTTPHEPTTLECYAAFAELAANLQHGRFSVNVQSAITVLFEVMYNALRDSPPEHIDAVLAEAREVVRVLGEAEAATGKA